MAQTYQMKHNPQGTIYSLLAVESNGQMTMTFHGTDREISHEANVTEDGRITTGGSLFPGLESGKWNKMDDVVETNTNNTNNTNEVAESETTTDNTDCTDNYAEPEFIETNTNCTNYTNNEPVTVNHEPLTLNQAKPKRQRKPRKPRVERQTSSISHQTSDIIHQTSDSKNLFAAIGMVAAATVALFVIYETGLLIPLGLIGLATGGILK